MRLLKFRVSNFRNIVDSGWVEVSSITAFVGQNECGKSNLLQALERLLPFEKQKFDLEEDWPIDKWGERSAAANACDAVFVLDAKECASVVKESEPPPPAPIDGQPQSPPASTPALASLEVAVSRGYSNKLIIEWPASFPASADKAKAETWLTARLPKCVYMDDYLTFAGHADIAALQAKGDNVDGAERTILTLLELAGLNLEQLISRGGSDEGRTRRGFDTNAASRHLSKQFVHMWKQRPVKFNLRVDATTLDVLVEDEGLDAFVPLKKRSRGFQWFVSFIWRFTHASKGAYSNCILLLDEPGVYLHHAGHRDLLAFLEQLSPSNVVLYTTHLSTMLDNGFPERLRILEVHDHHSTVKRGVVSSQREPMMVIEAALGLSAGMSGLLGARQNLIVEGVDDWVILNKLSGLSKASGSGGFSDRIFLVVANGASKTPMFASFFAGNGWDSGVLLDLDGAGEAARKKISEQCSTQIAATTGARFRVFMLGKALGSTNAEFAIEDMFPEAFYLECVNEAYGTNLTPADIPIVNSPQLCKRVEAALVTKGRVMVLDKGPILAALQKRFDTMKTLADLPPGTADLASKLFAKVNGEFA